MNFDQIIAEYNSRGISFSPAELDGLRNDTSWHEQCDFCESCGYPLLHDDEVYTDKDSGEWLCDDCTVQHDDGTCSKIPDVK